MIKANQLNNKSNKETENINNCFNSKNPTQSPSLMDKSNTNIKPLTKIKRTYSSSLLNLSTISNSNAILYS